MLSEPDAPVTGAFDEEEVTFTPDETVSDADRAFERYDLVTAPVVDDRGRLVSRLTIDAVMDFVRDAVWRVATACVPAMESQPAAPPAAGLCPQVA